MSKREFQTRLFLAGSRTGRPLATLFLGVLALWLVLEWLLFSLIAGQIGWFATIVLAIFKGGFGLILLGVVLRQMQTGLRNLDDGRHSLRLGEPLLAILGAILICLPGFVATIIGLALFAPSIRLAILNRFGQHRQTNPGMIDLGPQDYREID